MSKKLMEILIEVYKAGFDKGQELFPDSFNQKTAFFGGEIITYKVAHDQIIELWKRASTHTKLKNGDILGIVGQITER